MNIPKLTERFEAALVYAHQLHRHQTRKIHCIPYIAHLLSVTALVLEDGGNEDEAIAALLHDAVEDQGGTATRAEIKQRFGETVVAIVDGCTESDTLPKPPWRDRKQRYLDQLRQGSPSVRRVALADKLHNARSFLQDYRQQGENLWSVFTAGKEGLLWFYQSLLELYHPNNSSPMVAELKRVVEELEELVKPD
ncbi:MAG TPA: phosphohydrolase [Cyanobacteria bacterium UBA8803]|nr:phosphohydrolase [Cyanobacteria bacterium UBA9273]HBL57933.1 phosphohydrolase [Cyanobacteria bacterium UBA8803]